MTTTPAKVLTTAELARHLGRPCHFESKLSLDGFREKKEWKPYQGAINSDMLVAVERGKVRNVRPILRRLADMTPEDAKEVFNAAFGSPPEENYFEFTRNEFGQFTCSGYNKSITVYSDGRIQATAGRRVKEPQTFNAVAVINYLRERGYNIDGFIQGGLAIPAKP